MAVQRLHRQLGRYVYPLHRLDRATSGILLFALNAETAGRLGAAFTAGAIAKRYLAVVRGWPPATLCIDHALARIGEQAPGDPRPALTELKRLATTEIEVCVDRYPSSRYALVLLEPRTGRRHQLRRHLKHASHPIVGDTSYGQGRHNRLFRERYGCHRLLLAAVELEFLHPVSGAQLRLSAPLSRDFAAVVDALGLGAELPARWHIPDLGSDGAP